MLGLALAIDYSLFMVSRFREELRRGRDVATAVEITVATSGKAVTFSGLAVAVGLSGLLLFEPPRPALVRHRWRADRGRLGVLRPDLPAGRPRHARPARQRRRRGRAARPDPAGVRPAGRRRGRLARESRWERMAHGVMARPVAVLIPTLAFLLIARHAVPAPRAGHPGCVGPAAGHREPRGGGRPVARLPGRRDVADRRPRRRSRAPRPTRPTSSASSTSARPSTPSTGSTGSRGRSPGSRSGRPAPTSTPPASPPCSPRRATSSRRSSRPG